jgi:hypothetical protein
MKQFHMVMLLNCWNLSPEEIKALEKLKSEGRTLVFVYGPGIWNPESGIDLQRLSAVTKFSFTNLRKEVPLRIEWKKPSANFGLSNDQKAPVAFYPNVTEGDEVLGISADDKSPLALKHHYNDWTSIYIGAPFIPENVIRDLARTAGVHIWCNSNDPIYPTNEVVGMHANTTGLKRIFLPIKASRVSNWLTGEVVAENASEFTFEAEAKRTYLFHFGK